MLIDQTIINTLLPLRDSFLTLLEEQLALDNLENLDSYGEYLGTFPDAATIKQCWGEFLEKVTIYQRHDPTAYLQSKSNTPNIWWVHCYFGLLLYHFAQGQLPLESVIKVLVFELETETGIPVSKATVSNFWYVVQPNSTLHWVNDFDSRARFLYRNIKKKLEGK